MVTYLSSWRYWIPPLLHLDAVPSPFLRSATARISAIYQATCPLADGKKDCESRKNKLFRKLDKKEEKEHVGDRWPDNLLECIRGETIDAKTQDHNA